MLMTNDRLIATADVKVDFVCHILRRYHLVGIPTSIVQAFTPLDMELSLFYFSLRRQCLNKGLHSRMGRV